MGRIRRFPENATTEGDRGPYAFECIGGKFLRYQSDLRSGRTIIRNDVMTIGQDRAMTRIDDPANDVDQRRLACAVRAKECEDLSLADIQIDVFERLKAGRVCLGEVF